jgi:hypothetical protein
VLGGDSSTDEWAGDPNPGTGIVNTFEWQWTFSLARLLWNLQEKDFWGQGPDLQIAFWGMYNHVDPDNDLEPKLKRFARNKLKLGTEVMYTPLKYFGFGLRFDRVMPDLDYEADADDPEVKALNDSTLPSYAPFMLLQPKIRIKTAFVTHEEVNISYTRYFWDEEGRDWDDPPVRAEDPYVNSRADRNAFMLSVNMWW